MADGYRHDVNFVMATGHSHNGPPFTPTVVSHNDPFVSLGEVTVIFN